MQPGMVVSDETFKNHLVWLKKRLEIIRLLSIRKYFQDNTLPACVITLDDGWVDNYQYAFPILKELNSVATIFLVSNMVDTKHYFWPEKLSLLLNNPLTTKLLMQKIEPMYNNEITAVETYDDIVEVLKSNSDQVIKNMLDDVEESMGGSIQKINKTRQILSIDELVEMKDSKLIEYGSHTANHIRLDKVSPAVVINELIQSKEQLESKLQIKITTFCYPNGSYTSDVVSEVEKVYDMACTTESGWASQENNMLKLKRVMLHDDASNTQGLFWGRVLGFF